MLLLKLNSVTTSIEKPFLWECFFFTHKKMKKEEHPMFVKYLTMGVVAGLLLGLFMDDVGLWISLGTSTGAAVGYQKMERK